MMKDDWQDDWDSTGFESLDELQEQVKAAGGVLTVPLALLRNAYGAQRLGPQVRANMSAHLRSLGLGHTPSEIPDRQTKAIRIYELDSPVGHIIAAVSSPGPHEDETLLMAAETDAMEILRSIVASRIKLNEQMVNLDLRHVGQEA